MTLQAEEILRHRGRTYPLTSRPLETCADDSLCAYVQALPMRCTALHRGYRGTWEIKGCRLWLIDLAGTAWDHTGTTSRLDDEGAPAVQPALPMFAEWFTGDLESPRGAGARVAQYMRDWPFYRVFRIERGVVLSSHLRDNRPKFRTGAAAGARLFRMLDAAWAGEEP